jgi:hypothetical protein
VHATRTLALPLGILLISTLACEPPEPPRNAAAGAADPSRPGPGAPAALPSLDALDAALRAVEDSCEDSCCLAAIPPWLTLGHGIPDSGLLTECRRTLSAPASPRQKALAALCASATIDLRDVPAIAALLSENGASENGAAGAFPGVLVSQAMQACYSVTWSRPTLQEVALQSLGRITGQRFATPDEFRAWHRARGALESSFDFWEGALEHAPYDRRPELLASLRGRDALLYLRVVLMANDSAVHGVDPASTAAALRNDLGVPRLVRLLLREESFPEFTRDDRVALFVKRTADLADKTADPALAEGLLRLWEMETPRRADHAESSLALAASRLHPQQSRRILTATLRRLGSTWGPALQELAKLHPDEEAALLKDWFTSPRAGAEQEIRVAILTGLRARGAASVATARALILAPLFDTDNPAVLGALLDILLDADPRAAFPCRSHLWGGPLKNMPEPEVAARAKRAAEARRDCLARAKTWLRAPK